MSAVGFNSSTGGLNPLYMLNTSLATFGDVSALASPIVCGRRASYLSQHPTIELVDRLTADRESNKLDLTLL